MASHSVYHQRMGLLGEGNTLEAIKDTLQSMLKTAFAMPLSKQYESCAVRKLFDKTLYVVLLTI